MLNNALAILLQLLGAVLFFNRFVAGVMLRFLKRKAFDEADYSYQPTVTVVVPMFNEGEGIRRTIESLLGLEYPAGKLEIVVVDDCSTDDSFAHAQAVAAAAPMRVRVLRNKHNLGKRRSINRAVLQSRSEIIVSVDSDVVVDRVAVRELVARFVRPDIAAVGGWVDVRNKGDNWLTRMQTIKYFFSYHFLKNLEWAFRRVMCLSGCLTAYRRDVLVELHPILENRAILGVPIKYGEDRFLTRQIVKARVPDDDDAQGGLLDRGADQARGLLLAAAPVAAVEHRRLRRRAVPRLAPEPGHRRPLLLPVRDAPGLPRPCS
jgi:cellulose synthase/poly-beta-1,6-N-acetylglucosamine synthase-like glycosyltransferase